MRRQCKACPWRKDVDPRTIPNGYCELKHAGLANTIARPGALNFSGPLRVMACHEAPVGREIPCVGWMHNQYGEGNNIRFRLAVSNGQYSMDIEVVGEQHPTFEDTLARLEEP